MQPTLTLFQDIYADGIEAALPSGTRMLFVTHGKVTINADSRPRRGVVCGRRPLEPTARGPASHAPGR